MASNTTINQTGGSIEEDKGSVRITLKTITFSANGGSGTMAAQGVASGSTVKLNACTFTAPANCVFDGWKVGTTTYADGANVTVSADMTLVAQWRNTHTHSWGYAAGTEDSSNVITASCTTGCPLTSNPTLTLGAPALTTEGGMESASATVTKSTNWTEANGLPAVPSISKVTTEGSTTGGTLLGSAPTTAGYYYATVTVGAATAVKAYTIVGTPKVETTVKIVWDDGGNTAMRPADINVHISGVDFIGVLSPENNWTITQQVAKYKDGVEQSYSWSLRSGTAPDGYVLKSCVTENNTTTITLSCAHGDIEAVKAVSATCTKTGTKAHYKCKKCGKLFTDAEGTQETTLTALSTPALGHDYKNGKCTRCGAAHPNYNSGGNTPSYPSSTPSTPSTPEKKPEPKVGDKEGVPAIIEEIGKIPEGGTLPINMNGTTELPKEIIEVLKGMDVDLVLDMGGGVTWTINGKDIASVNGSIDLGVKLGTSGIPAEVRNNVTDEKYSTTLHLNHSGVFGFKAVMTVPLRKQDAGLIANLFYYDPNQKALEFVSSAVIDANGNADLDFNHASDYAIVIDDHSLDNPQFTAAVDGSSVKLTWDAVSGAANYNVYVAKNGKWSKLATTKKTTIDVLKLKNNKTYKFLVRAKVNGKLIPVGESYKLTVKVCYKPVLKATTKNGTITLKWSAVNNATKYRVVKSVNGEWKLVKETAKLTQTIRRVNSGNTYKYAVQAKVNGKWTTIGTTSTATVKVK